MSVCEWFHALLQLWYMPYMLSGGEGGDQDFYANSTGAQL